ncbi:MAG: hypothetical protein ACRD0Z_11380 [Acidimicrobiales bacterium]
MPVPLDEYPLHQVPLSMQYAATSDRNCYDRCYVNAQDRTGRLFVVTGLGVYPNLGVTDAYLTIMRDGHQSTLRLSDALGPDRMNQAVGPYRIEVLEPLRQLRLICEPGAHGIGADITWTGSFPVLDEPLHTVRSGGRVIVDGARFAQVGTVGGIVHLDGADLALDPAVAVGTRDRSWGIRPVGGPEPAGRGTSEPMEGFGFWWVYAPLRFEEFAIVLIAQEDGAGTRTTAEATRVWPESSGRVPEQLGWADFAIRYQPGSRMPAGATVTISKRGAPLVIEIDTLGHVLLNAGPGYPGDPDWSHGQWLGRGFAGRVDVDLGDPALAGQRAVGVVDHVCRATCQGQTGFGLFEHATFGAHLPSGFADWDSVAP